MNRNRIVALVVAVLATALAALFLAPGAPSLGEPADDTGDRELAARVRALVPSAPGYDTLSVALIENGATRFAGVGGPVTPRTAYENGSVTKVYTGMLLAEMVARGEVRPTDTLGDLLPGREFADPAMATVTLEELASHRAGLPRLAPAGLGGFVNSVWSGLSGRDPYRESRPDAVLDVVSRISVGAGRGESDYSNLGMAVLGQVLAERAGTPYPELVRSRVLTPVGMPATVHRPDGGAVPSGAARGVSASGRTVEPWADPAYAPAGIGDWSTAADLAALVTATMAGTAPGADAARPRFDRTERSRIGYAWVTTRYDDREITWHNGGTSGFHAYVGFDRAAGRGVVVLGNTGRSVDPVGVALLGGPADGRDGSPSWWLVGVTLVLLLAGVSPLVTALTGAGGRWWPAPDRLRLLSGLASAAAALAVAHVLGAWTVLPGVAWAAAFGAAVAALVVTGLRWRALPTARGGQRAVRIGTAAVSVAVSLAALGLVTVAAA